MLKPKLVEKLRIVPKSPGVYLWKDRDGVVIYVGKAKVLRNRVSSYQANHKDFKTRVMIGLAEDLDWMVADSEKAALILENTLIKKYMPQFNIALRDDKNFLSIKLTTTEDYPRLTLVRKVTRDGSKYYGPFSNARAARNTLNYLNRHFKLRECNNRQFKSRTRPCLNFQIGRSSGSCCGKIAKEDYGRIVKQVRMFFEGRGEMLIRELNEDMKAASEQMRFEDAIQLRDLIFDMRSTLQKQESENLDQIDRDIFGLYREGASGCVLALYVRFGKTIGQRCFPFTNQEEDDGAIIAQVAQAYYAGGGIVPAEILSPQSWGDMAETLADWLNDLRGSKVRLLTPQRGDKMKLLAIARENAKQQFEQRRARLADAREILIGVQKKLRLPKLPLVVECFDISNVQGRSAVGSQVTFIEGEPEKSRYRRYKIRLKDTPDDYAMMHEVLHRRVKRAALEKVWPDLILVDGGRGHLSIAEAVLRELGAEHISLAAITKIKNREPEDRGPEDMAYRPGRKNPVTFRRGSSELFFLQRIRDEAHRFAIEYHRKLRSKKQTRSILDDISGLGPSRRKALLTRFGSVKRITDAAPDEIAQTPGFSLATANDLVRRLKGESNA